MGLKHGGVLEKMKIKRLEIGLGSYSIILLALIFFLSSLEGTGETFLLSFVSYFISLFPFLIRLFALGCLTFSSRMLIRLLSLSQDESKWLGKGNVAKACRNVLERL